MARGETRGSTADPAEGSCRNVARRATNMEIVMDVCDLHDADRRTCTRIAAQFPFSVFHSFPKSEWNPSAKTLLFTQEAHFFARRRNVINTQCILVLARLGITLDLT